MIAKLDFDISAKDFKDAVAQVKAICSDGKYLGDYTSQTGIADKQLREQGIEANATGRAAPEVLKF